MNNDVKTMAQICKIYNTTAVTIKKWIDAGMPVLEFAEAAKRGAPAKPYKFSLHDTNQWVAENKTNPDNTKGNKKLEAAKLRKLQAEAERVEIRLQNEKNELIKIDDIVDIYNFELSLIKTSLLSLNTKLAPQLVGQTEFNISKIIKNEILKMLEDLTQDDEIINKILNQKGTNEEENNEFDIEETTN